MKTFLFGLLAAILVTSELATARTGVDSSGGTPPANPALVKTQNSEKATENWSTRECRIFLVGINLNGSTRVDLFQDDSLIQSKSLVFSADIKSIKKVASLIASAKSGTLTPASAVPELGTTNFFANIGQGPNAAKLVFLSQKSTALINNSPSAQILTRFMEQNCQFE